MKTIFTSDNSNDTNMIKLIEGYKKFKSQYFEKTKAFNTLVEQGQKPKVLVIACCDSRVDPAIITGCKPGELFVVRNVANLVPPFNDNSKHCNISAALEFGVLGLCVSNIIVFGHRYCGGIEALMAAPEDKKSSKFITAWMDIANSAKQKVLKQHAKCTLDEQCYYCEKESLLMSLNNLLTFPWINERVLKNQLFLHAWYFDLKTGIIESYQQSTGKFVQLAE